MTSVETFTLQNKIGSPVLCVIDFSDSSRIALQTAINIAGSTKSRLTALYPYRLNQPRSVPDVAQWKRSIDADASTSFSRMTSTLLKESDVAVEFKSEVGFINDRVEAFTQKHKVGLVVMSADLTRANKDLLLDLLVKLECPLLIVPYNLSKEL